MSCPKQGYLKYMTLPMIALSIMLSACTPLEKAKPEPTASSSPSIRASETPEPAAVPPNPAEVKAEPVATEPQPEPVVAGPRQPVSSVPKAQVAPANVHPGSAPVQQNPDTPVSNPTPSPTPVQYKNFAFKDGHISFSYPSNWSIVTTQGSYSSESDKDKSIIATVIDDKGNQVANVTSGEYGKAKSNVVTRTVIDSAPMSSFSSSDGSVSFAFVRDESAAGASYWMGLTQSEYVVNGKTETGSGNINAGNGMASASVRFGTPAFSSLEEAKSWVSTEQYKKLHTLLTSIKYS